MTALALTLALSLGGVDTLGPVTLGGLSFKGPTQWAKNQPEANSITWAEPQSGAGLEVTVYPVDPQRPAMACLKQMLEAVGKEGFAATTIGTQPASKQITTDYVGNTDAEKTDANKVTTTTLLGCNGKTKFVLTWTAKTTAGARFGPILKRVLDSISYGK
jgi:hypothetical protein